MNKSSKTQEQRLDDLLSEFTDQVLSDKTGEDMQETMAQDELGELQKTVLRMKAAAQKGRQSDNADVRIRNRLLMEWKKAKREEIPSPRRFNWNWTFPRLALVGGFVALIIFGTVTLLTTPSTTSLTATSGGSQSWSPLFIIVGIAIIIYFFWRNRRD
jgi:hypothetical protein